MAEPSSDDPEVTRALQAVAQNLLNPAFQVNQPRWVWHQTVCDFANSDYFLSKRKRPLLDPEDKENESSDDMSKNCCSFGRVYSRQSSPFNTVDSIVNFGIKHEASDDDSDNEPKTLTTQ